MKAVVLPENKNADLFRAILGAKSFNGKTIGEAIDGLIERFEPNKTHNRVLNSENSLKSLKATNIIA